MMRVRWRKRLAAAMVLALAAGGAAAAGAVTEVSHGRFERVRVLMPEAGPGRVVIWFAGDAARAGERRAQIEALRADGAMVALVDGARLRQVLARDGGACAFSAGDVENFSRYLQAFQHVPTYRLPLLAGDGDGAALAYAVAAQAPDHVFAGLLTEGLCPSAAPGGMICGKGVGAGGALQPASLPLPWLAATAPAGPACGVAEQAGFIAKVPQARTLKRGAHGSLVPALVAAARSLGEQKGVSLPPPPAALDDLPLVETAAAPGDNPDTFAIFVSGDGGWAGLDKNVAGALAQAGIPVVGLDSLRYFWTERTPASFAQDLDRIARYYGSRWKRSRVVLIGFSQGADVLPAAINQLPAATRRQLAMTALLSPAATADYEFHVSNWLGDDGEGLPVAPEMARLPAATTLCIYGQDDEDALCPKLPPGQAQVLALPGDHHFKGDYGTLARSILERLQAGGR